MKKIFSILFCAILFCSFIINPVMAAENYPSYESIVDELETKNHYGYVLTKQNDETYYLFTFSSVNTADAEFKLVKNDYNKANITFVDDDNKTYTFSCYNYIYHSTEDLDWRQLTGSTNITNKNNAVNLTYEILYSTHNIYNEDGTIFFQAPPTEITLAEAIQMVVEEEIPVTKAIIQNQMMTIVLCGVGCLALVISLVLLVKTLRRCLPQ